MIRTWKHGKWILPAQDVSFEIIYLDESKKLLQTKHF